MCGEIPQQLQDTSCLHETSPLEHFMALVQPGEQRPVRLRLWVRFPHAIPIYETTTGRR